MRKELLSTFIVLLLTSMIVFDIFPVQNIVHAIDTTPPTYSGLGRSAGDAYTNRSVILRLAIASCNWHDDEGLTDFRFSSNSTGSWINSTLMSMTGTSNMSTYVYQVNDTVGNKDAFKFYAEDMSGNWNGTSIFTATIYDDNAVGWTAWFTHEELVQMFKQIWNTQGLSSDYETIGNTTATGSPLWLFKCGNSSGPKILWDSLMHGDEAQGGELLLMLVNWLFNNSTEANSILNKDYLYFVPVVDYDYPNTGLNRTNADFINGAYYGVNLNRNFATNWIWPSQDWNTTNYEGPSPNSENETQAMTNLFANNNFTFYTNLHCGENGTAYYYLGPNNYKPAYPTSFLYYYNNTACPNFNATPYQESPKYPNTTDTYSAPGYAIAEADYHNTSAWLIETVNDQGSYSQGWNINGNFTLLQTYRLPQLQAFLYTQYALTAIFSPRFGMKTKNDGNFYYPNATYAPSFEHIRVEETFTNVSAGGDQYGLNVTGYPYKFPDGKVDGADEAQIALHFGQSEASDSWNYALDVVPNKNNDELGFIDGQDEAYTALHFGQGYDDLRWYSTNMADIWVTYTKIVNGTTVRDSYLVDSNGFVECFPTRNYTGIEIWNSVDPYNPFKVGALLTFWG